MNWDKIYQIPFLCMKQTKFQCFQYKILHRILPTNNFLFRIGYKDSSKCTFCYIHEETIEHLLFYCRHVNKLWNNLQFLCQKYGLFTFNISVQNVIFGIEVNDNIYNN